LIEPQVEMRPFLDRFCQETDGARWINAGAGASEGELKLTVFPDTVSSSFCITDAEAKAWGLSQRVVEVVTLDQVCRDVLRAIPDIVKIDVEGFEPEVLSGSQTLLGQTEVFLIELTLFGQHTNGKVFHEMIALMADYGYRVYDFTMFLSRPYDGAIGLCEVAFAREDGFLRSHADWY
jgi:FkbM family methyltransferase